MSTVLPGKPRSRLQGLTTGCWDARHISVRQTWPPFSKHIWDKQKLILRLLYQQAYITGSAFTILRGSQTILQTIYDDDDAPLEAITLDEATGKIATCTAKQVRVYKPFGLEHDALRVRTLAPARCCHYVPS
jgi:hypothetical protein